MFEAIEIQKKWPQLQCIQAATTRFGIDPDKPQIFTSVVVRDHLRLSSTTNIVTVLGRMKCVEKVTDYTPSRTPLKWTRTFDPRSELSRAEKNASMPERPGNCMRCHYAGVGRKPSHPRSGCVIWGKYTSEAGKINMRKSKARRSTSF